ncbi:hypothetical protein GCM10022212_14760 [Actimicrobium antarcticum]|uniref:Uncharacterized protein n=1 Tax=Actimicrobium antarcticum TaxID=1051899 RepID=A0ABP7T1K7_9BURK
MKHGIFLLIWESVPIDLQRHRSLVLSALPALLALPHSLVQLPGPWLPEPLLLARLSSCQ